MFTNCRRKRPQWNTSPRLMAYSHWLRSGPVPAQRPNGKCNTMFTLVWDIVPCCVSSLPHTGSGPVPMQCEYTITYISVQFQRACNQGNFRVRAGQAAEDLLWLFKPCATATQSTKQMYQWGPTQAMLSTNCIPNFLITKRNHWYPLMYYSTENCH